MKSKYQSAYNKMFDWEMPEIKPGKKHGLVVLGGRCQTPIITRQAIEYYMNHSEDFGVIALSGGLPIKQPAVEFMLNSLSLFNLLPEKDPIFDRDSSLKCKEACYMMDMFSELGDILPKEVIVEEESIHTGQNIGFIRDDLERMDIEAITILAFASSARRTLETARKELGDKMVIRVIPMYPFGIDKRSWADIPGIRNHVMSEYAKIDENNPKNYYNRGICSPLEIEEENNKIYTYNNQVKSFSARFTL